jgi:Tol biopolymer transport system component
MAELKDVFETVTRQAEPDLDSWNQQERRQRSTARNRKLGAFAVAASIAVVGALLFVRSAPNEHPSQPAGRGIPSTEAAPLVHIPIEYSKPVPDAPGVDYIIDLNTNELTPLPDSILQSVVTATRPAWGRFAASPDGSLLAYVGSGEEGSHQIFIASLDGTEIRQVTHDPKGAMSPAWSPDGTSIAYVGYDRGDVQNLFVLEIDTGETRQITDEARDLSGPSFTPDGSSLIYTDPGNASDAAEMRTVPVSGGQSTILFGGGHGGMGHAGEGSMSPDGSLVTMTGHEVGGPGAAVFLSKADGTQRRVIPAYGTDPAGTWSPDGSRIVVLGYSGHRIIVVNIATGHAASVAEGERAIWLDDHTLLIWG